MSRRWSIWQVVGWIAALAMTVPTDVGAWDSGTHTGLIQNSENFGRIVEDLGGRPEAIKHHLPSEMVEVCDRRETIADELMCGADDPDQKRRWYRLFSHKGDAWKRANKALICAVYHSRQPDRPGAQTDYHPPRMIARQLGESIHYLQDIADPTNRIGSLKGAVRLDAAFLVESAVLRAKGGAGVGQHPFDQYLTTARERMRVAPILETARDLGGGGSHPRSKETAEKIEKAYERWAAAKNRKDAHAIIEARLEAHALVLELLANIVALQERWLNAFLLAKAADRAPAPGQRDEVREACLGEGPMTASGRIPISDRWIEQFTNKKPFRLSGGIDPKFKAALMEKVSKTGASLLLEGSNMSFTFVPDPTDTRGSSGKLKMTPPAITHTWQFTYKTGMIDRQETQCELKEGHYNALSPDEPIKMIGAWGGALTCRMKSTRDGKVMSDTSSDRIMMISYDKDSRDWIVIVLGVQDGQWRLH